MSERILLFLLVVTGAGCNLDSTLSSPDASDLDGARDANTQCDPLGQFDPPVALAGFAVGTSPRLTPDELVMYFDARLGTDTSNNIYVAKRSSRTEVFGMPSLVNVSDPDAFDAHASVSVDDKTLIFESDRGGSSKLYVATRSSTLAEFDPPSLLVNVNGGAAQDGQPFLTADDQELWFVSARLGGSPAGQTDTFRARKIGSSFAAPVHEPLLSTTNFDQLPMLSADRLTIYIALGNAPGIFRAHRAAVIDGFPAPTPVPELDTLAFPGWLSPDKCRLYATGGTGGFFVAERRP